jgi:hypothetical protein
VLSSRLEGGANAIGEAAALGVPYPYPGFRGTVNSALRQFPQIRANDTWGAAGAPEGFSRYDSLTLIVNRQFARHFFGDRSAVGRHIGNGVGPGLPTERFGRQCILARRLAEAGVRFIEITAPVGWDHHFLLKDELTKSCEATDQPIAALLADLKTRGLLQDTLVIWAGEFGRTPYSQSETGRDHNNKGYTIWMAGGGVKPGFIYGATDDIGYFAVEDRMHIHDFHATVLHLMGLDHTRLTYNYSGRDFRLTDVAGVVAQKIIA